MVPQNVVESVRFVLRCGHVPVSRSDRIDDVVVQVEERLSKSARDSRVDVAEQLENQTHEPTNFIRRTTEIVVVFMPEDRDVKIVSEIPSRTVFVMWKFASELGCH